MKPLLAVGAALLLLLGGVAVQCHRYQRALSQYDEHHLPAFDPFVHVAMAEHPAFFTVSPWGYRLLTPWVVHAVPLRSVIVGFRLVTVAGIISAGLLLFFFLRRLGNGTWAVMLAVGFFGMSGPVGEAIRVPFLDEPVTVALVAGFLLAIECGASLSVLSLLMGLLTLAKGPALSLLFLPLVFLARYTKGRGRALGETALAGLPSVFLTAVLHLWWTPDMATPHPTLGPGLAGSAFDVLQADWGDTWRGALLGGLTPLALLGALRPRARPFLRRYGYLLLALCLLPFVAWINVPGSRPVPLFGHNVVRLLVYALPLLLPLALIALDRPWPHLTAPAPSRAPRPLWRSLATASVAACMAFPFLGLDRYRRIPLHPQRDGPLVLTFCRESLRTSQRLAAGRGTSWSLDGLRFVWGESDPGEMRLMRWFLRDGWGPLPHYGRTPAMMEGLDASLVLPSFGSADLDVTLALQVASSTALQVAVNGYPVGGGQFGPGLAELTVRVPASVQFRGDNILTIERQDPGQPGPILSRLAIAPARPGNPVTGAPARSLGGG